MKNSMSKRVIALVILGTMVGSTVVSAAEIEKSESVYVNLDSSGTVEKETASNWIHSTSGKLNITDISELNDIVNVKGVEKPIKSGNKLKWNINSSDLYYQGTTNKELPVGVKVKYYLDGKELSSTEIAGKSGKVKIEIEVVNNVYEDKDINGTKKRIYTPFSTALEVTLPVDQFSSVKCDRGTLLSEGKTSIATFVAFPGLKETLDTDKLDIDLSSKFTIEADVEEFSLAPIMIVATPELPDLDKLDEADTILDLKSALISLSDNCNKLVDATGTLADGNKLFYNNILLASDKLNNSMSLMNSSKAQEAITMLQSDRKMNQANKLIDDAYYAKDLDTEKAKKILSTFTSSDITNFITITKDTKAMLMHQQLLSDTLNSVKELNRDGELTSLIATAVDIKNQYDSISPQTKSNINGLLQYGTAENIAKIRNLFIEASGVKSDFQPVNAVLNQYIAATPGNSENEKTVNFLYGLRNSLGNAESLLSPETSSKLESLQSDVGGYASSYLILKSELALAYATGGEEGFNNKKLELKTSITSVYGGANSGAAEALTGYVDSLTVSDITAECLTVDSNKIAQYQQEIPTILDGVNSLSNMNGLISSINSVLYVDGEIEKIASLLGDLNDPTVQEIINSLGNTLVNMSDEDIQSIGNMLSSVNRLSAEISENEAALNSLITSIDGLSNNEELMKDINSFKNDLANCSNTLDKLNNIMGNISANDIDEINVMTTNLFSMQQDLKDSEDILRITKNALEKGNINQARNLLSSLPQLTSGVNQLVEGSNKLSNGAKELDEGMNKYKTEGIDKLYKTGTEGIKEGEDLLAIKNELVAQSKKYNTFTGKSDDMDGKVKFIMKTAEISYDKKVDTSKDKEKKEEKGFFAWLKDLFK